MFVMYLLIGKYRHLIDKIELYTRFVLGLTGGDTSKCPCMADCRSNTVRLGGVCCNDMQVTSDSIPGTLAPG